MTKLNEVYKCTICGNIVEVVHTGKGTLVCCGEPMNLLNENTTESQYNEKHVPVVAKEGDSIVVTVGSVLHPMIDTHYIEWVEVLCGDNVYRKNLKPGEEPVARFENVPKADAVRAYCNLHGLWKAYL